MRPVITAGGIKFPNIIGCAPVYETVRRPDCLIIGKVGPSAGRFDSPLPAVAWGAGDIEPWAYPTTRAKGKVECTVQAKSLKFRYLQAYMVPVGAPTQFFVPSQYFPPVTERVAKL